VIAFKYLARQKII